MTLKELIDISENDLIISEGGYDYPFITLKGLDCNLSEEFKDVLSPEMLNRKVEAIKPVEFGIKVWLEVLAR